MFKEKVVPNNKLKNIITELLEWCDHKDKEGELAKTFFSDALSDEIITQWENKNNITIPESYKEWLRFSGKCVIDGSVAEFFEPEEFRFEYVPDDYVVIGEVVGDGEVVCFSKESGEFIRFLEGRIRYRYSEFGSILKDIIELMGKEEPDDNQAAIIQLKKMKAILESKLNGSNSDEMYLKKLDELNTVLNRLENK